MSNSLSKRIEITCKRCGKLYEISVPSDVVSWDYGYGTDCLVRFKCPHCEKRTTINLIKKQKNKQSGEDHTRVY
ncbi:MAG: hypothetical protein PVF58_05215 [Candidatus Methanofastidiosia archaeon]|jgi:hypothetical protein